MFLYDTNVVSELVRPNPNPGVIALSQRLDKLYLSVVTVEEIFFGMTAKHAFRMKQVMEDILQTRCVILPVTGEIARRAGELRGELRTKGETRTQADMLISATAQIHQLTVVTRNVRDFEKCGVPILNPFD